MQNEFTEHTPPSLADELNDVPQYERASAGQRFLNYLVDNLLMRFGLTFVTGSILGFLLGALAPEFLDDLDPESALTGKMLLLTLVIGYSNYIIYYTICERVFNGLTLGKLLTGTRAIREDGDPLTWRNALLRSLSRIVPFEPFSAFGGQPWHDTWTNTAVVKTR